MNNTNHTKTSKQTEVNACGPKG